MQNLSPPTSAFRNSGFSLNRDSFVAYRDGWTVNSVLSGLIIIGGIGYVVIAVTETMSKNLFVISLCRLVIKGSDLLVLLEQDKALAAAKSESNRAPISSHHLFPRCKKS